MALRAWIMYRSSEIDDSPSQNLRRYPAQVPLKSGVAVGLIQVMGYF